MAERGRENGARVFDVAASELFAGPGIARAELRSTDWAANPLGPVAGWPAGLRVLTEAVLASDFPQSVAWGPQYVQIPNDAFLHHIGVTEGAGVPARVAWPAAWEFMAPRFAEVKRTGRAVYAEDCLVELGRDGHLEEAHFTFCYSPLYAGGQFAGVLDTSLVTTGRVLTTRRLDILRKLLLASAGDGCPVEICRRAAAVLAEDPKDVPFALFYLHGQPGVAAACGVEAFDEPAGGAARMPCDAGVWRVAAVMESGAARTVNDLASRLPGWRPGPWPEGAVAAHVLPLRVSCDVVGAVVLGLSPRVPFDERYRSFCELVAAHVGAALAVARSQQVERERSAQLAEASSAKTRFLHNVSHELRTPLTLLTGPLAVLADAPLAEAHQADLSAARRAAARLSRLVESLLEVALTEEGRLSCTLEPTDLPALTEDVAGMFRAAMETAGLAFDVEAAALPYAVEVDPEMWTKIVANLLSNALKFTPAGTVSLRLEVRDGEVVLRVADTGVGIPAAELDRVFERFHRVPPADGHTAEGVGIGLAMVAELVTAHGGSVRVESAPGAGSTFIVALPHRARAALPAGELDPAAAASAEPFVAEAAGWAAAARPAADDPAPVTREPAAPTAQILVVEDNADLRDFLARLLRGAGWAVRTAGDVAAALDGGYAPDLVLCDVMLPGASGVELVRALRADPGTEEVPVVLLTARAEAGAVAEGLAAGANDYVTKPFEPAELVARVRGLLEVHRRRAEALRAAREQAAHLETALQTSRRIGTAVGILMAMDKITAEEAIEVLKTTSQHRNRKLRDLAEHVVLTGALPEVPGRGAQRVAGPR